ncbi:MAG: phosphodiester glycosidase family protein [Clostridia bacterium]|nr:phosphodiester glycosidase family protein [Clostridia bacterium]
MKKLLILLAVLLLALPACALADEVDVEWKNGSKKVDSALLTDGDDSTMLKIASAKSQELTCDLTGGDYARMVYVRTNSMPEKVQLQFLNSSKKWETAAEAVNPGPECVLISPKNLTGRLRLLITYAAGKPTQLLELRLFSDTELPEGLHNWEALSTADVLVTLDTLEGFDPSILYDWAETGRSIAVASLSVPAENPVALTDALWDAGLRVAPVFGGYKAPASTKAATVLKNWGEKKVEKTVASWLRQYQPMMLVNGGEVMALVLEDASANAVDPSYEQESATAYGLWSVPTVLTMADDVINAIQDMGERDASLVRAACLAPFADAAHGDLSAIEYPDNRDEDGYLTDGEFLYEDAENGLWVYLSPTVQVEIVQYDMTNPIQRYFVADVKFKPEEEMFKQHVYLNATFKGQQIWPQTLAQTSKMVIAVNGDYYPYRVEKKNTVGNILRNYEVLYNMDMKKNPAFPNLDTMALHDDGTMSVYGVKEITADELAAMGDVHDALSFGPYLARDGRLRIYDGKNATNQEPRCAIGMVEAGHYIIVNCEGRVPKGPKGMSINQIGLLLYGHGCNEAFMLDGGSTSVLIFMGEKLNRTGKDTSIGSPRNQHELFGVGTSDLVHTDWVNGKPKK